MGYSGVCGADRFGERFSQDFYLLLMCEPAEPGTLSSIANLIGERGEMAKQPLPHFCQWLVVRSRPSAVSYQLSAVTAPTTYNDNWQLPTGYCYDLLLCQS